jgi:hypothetical protein
MKTIQRFIEIPLSEIQSEDVAKVWAQKGEQVYAICGKDIKEGQKTKYIHLLTNGNIISYSGNDIENSQGLFPVGASCAKKLVIDFAF